MRITRSNVLLGNTPTITKGASGDDPAGITDPDFSTNYTSSLTGDMTISFGAVNNIDYVGVAGLNIGDYQNYVASVQVFNGTTLVAQNNLVRNNCVLINFDTRNFTDLVVKINNGNNFSQPRVSFVAAGVSFEVPNNGENSGYNRQFLNRNIKAKTTINDIAAPTAYLKKKVAASGRLSLPNMTKEFSETIYQFFLDFAIDNYFFIREQDGIEDNSSAYLCYELSKNQVTAHSQTRSLNNISFSFKVFNGL